MARGDAVCGIELMLYFTLFSVKIHHISNLEIFDPICRLAKCNFFAFYWTHNFCHQYESKIKDWFSKILAKNRGDTIAKVSQLSQRNLGKLVKKVEQIMKSYIV